MTSLRSCSETGFEEQSQRNYLQEEQRIKESTNLSPRDLGAQRPLFDSIPRDLPKVRFFTRHAGSLDWLEWAGGKRMLDTLFSDKATADLCDYVMGWWLAEKYACAHIDAVLDLVARHDNQINTGFGNAIALNLQHCALEDRNQIIRKWVAVLIGLEREGEYFGWFEHLMRRCVEFGEVETVMMLFEHITRPRLVPEVSPEYMVKYFGEFRRISLKVRPADESGMLGYNWQKFIKPEFPTYCKLLLPIITSHIQSCFSLRSASSGSLTPYSRWEVPHYLSGLEKFLYNCADDSMEWLCYNEPEAGRGLIEFWLRAETPLLRKLAVKGLAQVPQRGGKAIEKLFEHNLLFDEFTEHEVADILAKTYRLASGRTRKKLHRELERQWTHRPARQDDGIGPIEEHVYRLVNAALKSDESDQGLLTLRQVVEERYPNLANWKQRIMSPPSAPIVEDVVPGVSAESLRKMSPADAIEAIEDKQGIPRGWRKEFNLRELSQAVRGDFEWSERLIAYLHNSDNWDRDLWDAVFGGWVAQAWDEIQWGKIIGVLLMHPRLEEHLYGATSLLSDGMEGKNGQIAFADFDKAIELASRLWALSEDFSGEIQKSGELYIQAMTSNGGKLALFWLHALSRAWKTDDQQLRGKIPLFKADLEKMIKGDSDSSKYARVILASQFAFLWTREEEWAREHVLLWFDWSKNESRALEAWSGFIVNGRLLDGILPLLFSHYLETAGRLHRSFSEKEIEVFIVHVAIMALYRRTDELEEDWLMKFIAAFSEADRNWFAWKIRDALANNGEEKAVQQWNRWVKRYWEDRNSGKPAQLGAKESGIMISWAVCLKPVFEEVVEVACGGSHPEFEHTSLFRDLEQTGLPVEKAGSLLSLLTFILGGADEDFPKFHFGEIVEILGKIEHPGQFKHEVFRICNDLARLGYEESLSLAERMGVLNYSPRMPEGKIKDQSPRDDLT